MSSNEWGQKSSNMAYNMVTLVITPLIITHEPSSRDGRVDGKVRPQRLKQSNP